MAKNVKYRMYFNYLDSKEYRIDIYDEYSGNPIELTAGETPIVTSEENSENIETNLRPSTGIIQVCTKVPADSVAAFGKSMVTIEDMLPQDNADRCVVLQHNDGNNWVTDWQGFISCEVYNQDYVSVPQNLEIPIIGMIEALDSIKLKSENVVGLITIKKVIKLAFEKLSNASGISLFDRVYFPHVNCEILNKYIDPSILIEMSMHDNENRVDYVENGNSYKTIIENICKVMGWCLREYGRNLYFMPINHNTGDSMTIVSQSYQNFMASDTFSNDSSPFGIYTIDMSTIKYKGTGHKKSINQGKTFVEIIANIKEYENKLSLPSNPRGEYIQGGADANLYGCSNYLYSRFSEHNYVLFNWYMQDNSSHISNRSIRLEAVSMNNMTRNIMLTTDCFQMTRLRYYYNDLFVFRNIVTNPSITYYTCSFFARWKDFGTFDPPSYVDYHVGSDSEGLVIFGVPNQYRWASGDNISSFYPITIDGIDSHSYYVYKQESPLGVFINSGSIKFNLGIGYYDYACWQTRVDGYLVNTRGHKVNKTLQSERLGLYMAIKCGDYFYNGSDWVLPSIQNRIIYTWIYFANDNLNLEMNIPVNRQLNGKMTIYISPFISGTFEYKLNPSDPNVRVLWYPVNAVLIKNMSLSYNPDETEYAKKSTNNYFRILDTRFHDGLSIHTDIATKNLNNPSPSLIIDSFTDDSMTFLEKMSYNLANGTTEQRRIENDLLDRLSKWYGKIRRKIDLEIERPNQAPLPMMKIRADSANGYDGKLYIPIAESIDWKTGISTVTCLEDSDGDE